DRGRAGREADLLADLDLVVRDRDRLLGRLSPAGRQLGRILLVRAAIPGVLATPVLAKRRAEIVEVADPVSVPVAGVELPARPRDRRGRLGRGRRWGRRRGRGRRRARATRDGQKERRGSKDPPGHEGESSTKARGEARGAPPSTPRNLLVRAGGPGPLQN